jgi:hypothetical protein
VILRELTIDQAHAFFIKAFSQVNIILGNLQKVNVDLEGHIYFSKAYMINY